MKEIEGTYIKEPIDIVLTETNVDSLSMDTIKITVSANGEPKIWKKERIIPLLQWVETEAGASIPIR